MYNWFAIETEANFRCQEWQRAAAAEARGALAQAGSTRPRRFRFPRLSLLSLALKRIGLPRSAFASHQRAACEAAPGD
jgi:hypothetical protein